MPALLRFSTKGDHSLCRDYRGISLLIRSCRNTNELTPSRSRRDPTRIPMWFPALERHCRHGLLCAAAPGEVSSKLILIFWDLHETFNKVPKPGLWAILARSGSPDRFESLICMFHDGMEGRVNYREVLADC